MCRWKNVFTQKKKAVKVKLLLMKNTKPILIQPTIMAVTFVLRIVFSKSLQRRARCGEGTRQVKVKSSQVPEMIG
jgi:hypothetical protein